MYDLLSSAKNCRILSILEYMAGLGSIFTTFQSLPSIEVSDVCKHIERCISRQIEESISSSFQCVYKYFDKIEAFFVKNIIHCCSPISWDLLIREGVKKKLWKSGQAERLGWPPLPPPLLAPVGEGGGAIRWLLSPTGTLKTPWGYKGLAQNRALFWSIWGFPYFGQFRVPCIAPRLKSAVHR